MAETLRKSLPLGWHLILLAMLLLGLFLAIMPIPTFQALGRLSSRIPADALYRVIGIMLVAAVMTHWVVFAVLRGIRSLFGLVEGTDTARENLWPPVLLGLCESTMYTLALVIGQTLSDCGFSSRLLASGHVGDSRRKTANRNLTEDGGASTTS